MEPGYPSFHVEITDSLSITVNQATHFFGLSTGDVDPFLVLIKHPRFVVGEW